MKRSSRREFSSLCQLSIQFIRLVLTRGRRSTSSKAWDFFCSIHGWQAGWMCVPSFPSFVLTFLDFHLWLTRFLSSIHKIKVKNKQKVAIAIDFLWEIILERKSIVDGRILQSLHIVLPLFIDRERGWGWSRHKTQKRLRTRRWNFLHLGSQCPKRTAFLPLERKRGRPSHL